MKKYPVGPGWWPLLNILEQEIKQDCLLHNAETPSVTQIKEKFGGLRYYYYGGTKDTGVMVAFAEALSNHICEECGTMKDVSQNDKGWIRTLCKKCRGKREK